jgi:hypothetical protein
MRNTALEKLFFPFEIIVKVTKTGGEISKSLRKVEENARTGFMSLEKGALSIGGTTTAPRDFTKAIVEVSTLDAPQTNLNALSASTKQFSIEVN